MYTPYNLTIPTVLFPVKEVPLFGHQQPPSPPHQSEALNDAEQASTKSAASKDKDTPKPSDDHNEWSTLQPTTSAPKHGWLHLPSMHFPHPHVDLSHLRRHKVVIPPSSDAASGPSTSDKDSSKPRHYPYLPSSPFWPTHLFPANSPFHHVSSSGHPAASTAAGPYIPAATVRELPQYYVIELDAPGLSASAADSVSATWMSPRTVLVSGESCRTPLPLNDDQDGGSLCRTPTHEEVPPVEAGEGATAKDEAAAAAAAAEEEDAKTQQKVLFAERPVGPWRRSFVLPSDAAVGVDPSEEVGGEGRLKWEVEDGVVRVWVPRARG